jgi:triphosphoribosyl-dephospho-CoA synthase
MNCLPRIARKHPAAADVDVTPRPHGVTESIGRLAVRALYHEAVLYPKPGLVSPVDCGAHRDMSIATFYRSLFALRGYFPAIAALGADRPPLRILQRRGMEAEAAMLRATGGVNTHRGAIFNLGLLCAAAGAVAAAGERCTADAVCMRVRRTWGRAIRRDLATAGGATHGLRVLQTYGVGGARAEAAGGFRSVRRYALPAFRAVVARTCDRERASLQALFVLIAQLDDSNLLWRGEREGLAFAQHGARYFLARGGVLAGDWRATALRLHHAFVRRGLSPGGSADLLAVTLFLDELDPAPRGAP